MGWLRHSTVKGLPKDTEVTEAPPSPGCKTVLIGLSLSLWLLHKSSSTHHPENLKYKSDPVTPCSVPTASLYTCNELQTSCWGPQGPTWWTWLPTLCHNCFLAFIALAFSCSSNKPFYFLSQALSLAVALSLAFCMANTFPFFIWNIPSSERPFLKPLPKTAFTHFSQFTVFISRPICIYLICLLPILLPNCKPTKLRPLSISLMHTTVSIHGESGWRQKWCVRGEIRFQSF